LRAAAAGLTAAGFGFVSPAAGFAGASVADFVSAGLASAFSSFGFSAGGLSVAAGSLSPAILRWPSLSALKSVSYQPPPFSRKTGAEIRRRSVERPQAGHLRSGPALIFWSSSWGCPQAERWYS